MSVIIRRWTGTVPHAKAQAYLDLMHSVAIPDYRQIDGNIAALCLFNDRGTFIEVEMLTYWRDMEAVRAFAGSPPERAKYYDFDADYLLSLPLEVSHSETHAAHFNCPKLINALANLPANAPIGSSELPGD